jgi:hypothetical protein
MSKSLSDKHSRDVNLMVNVASQLERIGPDPETSNVTLNSFQGQDVSGSKDLPEIPK